MVPKSLKTNCDYIDMQNRFWQTNKMRLKCSLTILPNFTKINLSLNGKKEETRFFSSKLQSKCTVH